MDNQTRLRESLNTSESVEKVGSKWFQNLKKSLQNSFRKVRYTGKVRETQATALLKEKEELQQKLKISKNGEEEDIKDKIFGVSIGRYVSVLTSQYNWQICICQ